MLAKDRLGKRRFGHVRHNNYYKNLIEPENEDSLSWADPKRKEFWRTDVEPVLHKQEDKRRVREKVGHKLPICTRKSLQVPTMDISNRLILCAQSNKSLNLHW